LNEVQIDNKNLSDENAALKTRLEAKERRVTHLENKVTQILIENEENVLHLKSEIILFKNQIDQNEAQTNKQLLQMRERVEDENVKANGQKLSQMQSLTEKLNRENQLHLEHVAQLNAQYSSLHEEFEHYRRETQEQEAKRDVYVVDLEQRLATLSKNHVKEKHSSGDKIALLEKNLL